MKKVVFLDYDGVVNRKMWVNENGGWVCRFGGPDDGEVNDIQAVQWVSEFCEKYGYDIVVTSSWRKYKGYEACLRAAGLRDGIKILGSTSLPARDRAEEISDYLAEHPQIEAYLVFDDDPSLVRKKIKCDGDSELALDIEGDHYQSLVLCCSGRGFGEEEYNKAVAAHMSRKYRLATDVPRACVPRNNDEMVKRAVLDILYTLGKISTSIIQRKLDLGYGRAARIIDMLLERGVIMKTGDHGYSVYKPLIEKDEAQKLLGIDP